MHRGGFQEATALASAPGSLTIGSRESSIVEQMWTTFGSNAASIFSMQALMRWTMGTRAGNDIIATLTVLTCGCLGGFGMMCERQTMTTPASMQTGVCLLWRLETKQLQIPWPCFVMICEWHGPLAKHLRPVYTVLNACDKTQAPATMATGFNETMTTAPATMTLR